MSGVLKSVGKVFKKVVKAVVKWAPVILAVGAVVFTAGAALGALPAWGTAISSVTSSLGLSSGLTSVLTGAVTQAGFGAAIGAAGAAVTGKDIFKGAGLGAAAGAVTGGITGFMSAPAAAAAPAAGAAPATTLPGTGTGLLPASLDAAGAAPGALATANPATFSGTLPAAGVTSPLPAAAASAAPAAAAAAPGAASTGLLGWANANPVIAGGAISGIGNALASFSTAGEGAKERAAERRVIADNYDLGGGTGLLQPRTGERTDPNAPLPSNRYDPPSYNGQFQYDATKGKVVFVPNEGAA